MSTEPLVSVIVPAYRAEATLPAAVRSLLAQTCPSWRAIVASDDGVDYLAVLARAGIRDGRLQQVSTAACGSSASLEDFLDMTENGRAPWVEAELARLLEEPCRAA